MPQAEEVFSDLMPGGVEAHAALVRHNHNLGRYGACDGSCGQVDRRRPYFDEFGVTRYGATSLPQRPALLELPVEDDYPASAWEVDE
jgi:hypothetical protein